jgi:two-component sensor histidine kinase
VQVSLYVVRAFVRLREAAFQNKDLAKQLSELQDKTESLAMSHETFSRNTRNQLKQVFDTLRELVTPPEPHKRPIGFITPEDKSKPKAMKSSQGAKRDVPVKALGLKKAKK